MSIRAVLFDFGGVILTSPFEAFARYETDRGLPAGFLRQINTTNPDSNAWAQLERGEVDIAGFCARFEAEAMAGGHRVVGAEVLDLLHGDVRPEMVDALRRCHERLSTALLTNNFIGFADGEARHPLADVLTHFDVIVESSKAGVRKPDPRFYELACAELGIAPSEAVFLDDLGINLKPARAMGMTTIKVTEPETALDELAAVLGLDVR